MPSRFETNTSSLPSGVNASAASSCCVGGESKSPGVRSRGVSARQRRDEHMMAHVLAPLVPVAIEQARQAMDVRRRVRALLHVRHERDRRAVGGNHHRRLHAAGDLRELPDVAAVGVGDIDLRIAVASGDEGEVRTVGVPARRVLASCRRRSADAAAPSRRPARSRCRRCACRSRRRSSSARTRPACRRATAGDRATRTAPSRSWMVIGRCGRGGRGKGQQRSRSRQWRAGAEGFITNPPKHEDHTEPEPPNP